MSVHVFVRFEPRPEKRRSFARNCCGSTSLRERKLVVVVYVFESLQEPFVFAIHSEWRSMANIRLRNYAAATHASIR